MPLTPTPAPPTPPADAATVTDVLFVIDMSGSMAPIAQDVRGGFNTYLTELAAKPGTYRITVTVFDSAYGPTNGPAVRCVNLCTAAALDEVPLLTAANYQPHGGTPLLDAIGKTLTEFAAVDDTDSDGRVLLVVQTDGAENTSREFTGDQIRTMITQREATGRWTALFLGANLDAVDQAGNYGFAHANTVVVGGSAAATRATYSSLATSTAQYAAGASGAEAARHIAENTPGSGA